MSIPFYGSLCHDGECLGMIEDHGTPIREFFRYHGKIFVVDIQYPPNADMGRVYGECNYTVHEINVLENHNNNPVHPIKLDDYVFCGCDTCVQARYHHEP